MRAVYQAHTYFLESDLPESPALTTSRFSVLLTLAERQPRPAVIARKISCGNKTLKGARTWQILASLAATCAQRPTSFIDALARAAPLQAR